VETFFMKINEAETFFYENKRNGKFLMKNKRIGNFLWHVNMLLINCVKCNRNIIT
jgi:hypothetical protein